MLDSEIMTASMVYPPRIELALKPQLAEAKSERDDWTGTNDAKRRRQAQTRLNMRAYRKRKALAQTSKLCSTSNEKRIRSEPLVECWDNQHQSISTLPASRMEHVYNMKHPLLPTKPNKDRFKRHIIFPLSSDHLITLLQFNALRALAVNRTLISGILVTPLDCSEGETVHIIPYPTKPEVIPPQLLPTILQQTVPHPDWIDLFPSPEARDRVIRRVGTFDEDDLWADCIGGLYEGFPDDEIERRGIVAWSPPWDVSGWEMSAGFMRKWTWMFEGMPDVMSATNRWRIQRGEEPFIDDIGTVHALEDLI